MALVFLTAIFDFDNSSLGGSYGISCSTGWGLIILRLSFLVGCFFNYYNLVWLLSTDLSYSFSAISYAFFLYLSAVWMLDAPTLTFNLMPPPNPCNLLSGDEFLFNPIKDDYYDPLLESFF